LSGKERPISQGVVIAREQKEILLYPLGLRAPLEPLFVAGSEPLRFVSHFLHETDGPIPRHPRSPSPSPGCVSRRGFVFRSHRQEPRRGGHRRWSPTWSPTQQQPIHAAMQRDDEDEFTRQFNISRDRTGEERTTRGEFQDRALSRFGRIAGRLQPFCHHDIPWPVQRTEYQAEKAATHAPSSARSILAVMAEARSNIAGRLAKHGNLAGRCGL
jgi:hypothetical protein